MPGRPRIAAACTLTALVLAACGGGSPAGPTRAEYTARADGICRDAATTAAPLLRRLAAGASALSPARARRLAPLSERLHALSRAYVDRLAALPRPAKDREEIARFLLLSRQVSDAVGRAARAASEGSAVGALAALRGVQQTAREANDAAAAYGLSDCATVLPVG